MKGGSGERTSMGRLRALIDRIYAAISRTSPLVYLVLYLLLIPAFAVFYTYAPAQTFYAPYAKFESHAGEDVYAFERRLSTSFNRAIQAAPRQNGHWIIKRDNLNVLLKAGPNPDQLSISVTLDLTRDGPQGREDYSNVAFDTVVSYHPVLATAEPRQICREVTMSRRDHLLGDDASAIFHTLFHGEGPCAAGDFLVLDPEGDRQLSWLLQGWVGDPSKFSGQFGRLLYFSAITVTTVGIRRHCANLRCVAAARDTQGNPRDGAFRSLSKRCWLAHCPFRQG
jgi:hypothetical protein